MLSTVRLFETTAPMHSSPLNRSHMSLCDIIIITHSSYYVMMNFTQDGIKGRISVWSVRDSESDTVKCSHYAQSSDYPATQIVSSGIIGIIPFRYVL